ncbi:hypothetical protein PHMEG_00024708 [Phytophthora megakarya]|uniref:Tyr recombinase domain-containing protein n=1 Tax=Phytophthora megakarya TaxID=4795 RepID=A0A225VDU7_9STRA|nr:hypothetical protein PHMEG_00024708 [Phytophthora megakarya]
MGSLHHVATCIRAARPFLQRLRLHENQLHRFQRVTVFDDMKQGLLWWWQVLHTPHLNGVSLGYFNALLPSDVVVEVDASAFDLCALGVFAKAALTHILEFKNGSINSFNINFRELLSCAFAVQSWGALWSSKRSRAGHPYHVHFRIDNASAVAWQNKMTSRNPRAQAIIRLVCWWETSFHLKFFRFTRARGCQYAGSRISANESYATLFSSLTPDSTFDQYRRALVKWTAWSSRRGIPLWLGGVSLDLQVQHISDFILYGFQFGFGSGRPTAAIQYWLFLKAFDTSSPLLELNFRLNIHTFACCSKGSVTSIHPEFANLRSPSIFWWLVFTVFASTLPPIKHALEIVATSSSFFTWFAIRAQDIAVLDDLGRHTVSPHRAKSVCLRLVDTKTNQCGVPTSRMLSQSGHPYLCPLFGAPILPQAWRNLPVDIPAAVYVSATGLPVCITTTHVADTIKRAATNADRDPRHFSSHSLRYGGTTHMYRSGADALTIQFHGRWVSDALRHTPDFARNQSQHYRQTW